MKKLIILLLSLLFVLSGCSSSDRKTIQANDVAASISDVYSDSEGNVTLKLIDGRTFSLGNLKGEKGDKGDPGRDGVDGMNGKNGINGFNGLNGIDGKNGKDGLLPDSYVSEIEMEDVNIIKVTYGDGSTNSFDRVSLSGNNKCTIEYRLLDSNNQLITSVYDYLFYDGSEVFDYIATPIDYDNKHYFGGISNCEFLDETENGPGGAGPSSFGFELKCPNHDCKVIINYKQKYKYSEIGYCETSNGIKNLFERYYYSDAGEEIDGYFPFVTEFNNDYYFCNMGSPIFEMPSEDHEIKAKYDLAYSDSQLDDMLPIPSLTDIGNCISISNDDLILLEQNLSSLFDGFSINFEVKYPIPSSFTYIRVRPILKTESGKNISLLNKYVHNNCPFSVVIEED